LDVSSLALDDLAGALLAVQAERDPIEASLAGLPGYDDLLPDPADSAEQALASRADRIAEQARRLDPATLNAADRVTREVVIHAAGSVADSVSARILEHTVSDTFTSPSHYLLGSLPLVPVSGTGQAAAYLRRLAAVPRYLKAVADRHSHPSSRPRPTAEPIAFHEAVPGHHFQLALAQELTELPLLRRLATTNAYVEGWALYAERLADEMGLYSSDLARLGMITEDSCRAGRLVVDTGLHALGWTRQRAVDYLRGNTAMLDIEIDHEVDRYIAEPAQALSYMTGRLEIQRLRRRAEHELGDRFDVRAFHDAVLGGGALPLVVLADVVAEWIATVR
jgi:uncharacterized protein (DUF885 family)